MIGTIFAFIIVFYLLYKLEEVFTNFNNRIFDLERKTGIKDERGNYK